MLINILETAEIVSRQTFNNQKQLEALKCFEILVGNDEVLDTLMTVDKAALTIAQNFHPVNVELTHAFCEILSGFLFASQEGHD